MHSDYWLQSRSWVFISQKGFGRKQMKKKYIGGSAVLLIISGIFLAILISNELNKNEPDLSGLLLNIGLSVLCSMIASVLYSMLQFAISSDEQKNIVNRLNEINEKLVIQNELYDSGIVSIRKKSYYDRDGKFWKDILASSLDRFDLIGHSISNWFDDEYKKLFVGKVTELLKRGNSVRIILSDEKLDISKIKQAERHEKYKGNLNKVERTCYELRMILRNVPKNKRKKLRVFYTDLKQVSYMYIRTDHKCFISPYIYSTTNSSNSFLLELETGVDYSRCFDNDFSEMIENKSICKPINLEDDL